MRSFVRDTAYTFGARILALGVGVATSAIVARYLGPEGRGIYALALLLPSLVTNFVLFGIGSATTYHAARGEHSLKHIVGGNLLMLLAVSGIGLITGTIAIVFISDIFFGGVSKQLLSITLLLIPFRLLFSLYHPVLLGSQRFLAYNAIELFSKVLLLMAMAVLLVGLRGGVEQALHGTIFAALLSGIVLMTRVRHLSGGVEFRGSGSYVKSALSFGGRAYIGNMLSFLHLRVDLLLLNFYLNPFSVGLYAIVVALVDQLSMISRAASIALFPRIAAESENERNGDLTPLVTRTVLLVTAGGGCLLCLVASPLVRLIYSEMYLSAVTPLRILVIGVSALAGARVLGSDIAGRGKPMLNSYTTGVALLANIVLNVVLIPRWGIPGAAWASAGTYTLLFILRGAAYVRLSGQHWGTLLLPQRSDWVLYREGLSRILATVRLISRGGNRKRQHEE